MECLTVYLLIVLFSCTNIVSAIQSRYVIGFYSACFNRSNKTILHRKAGLYYNMTENRINTPCVRTSLCLDNIVVPYEGYDVCENFEQLLELFLRLHLDVNKMIQKNGLNLIVAFLTPWMQKLLFEIDTTKEIIPMAVFDEDAIQPSLTKSKDFIIMDISLRNDVFTFSQMITNFKWEKLGIFHLENNFHSTKLYLNLYHEFILFSQTNHSSICFYREKVEMSDKTGFHNVFKKLHHEYLPNVVILFGLPNDQARFFNIINRDFYINHIWVL